jgi:putative PIN family toxin of toxin-antitoxin system
MRVVLDTAVLVAAIRSDAGASRHVMVAALEGRLAIAVSVPLVIEYGAVMTRAEHLSASGLSESEVAVLLDAVCAVAVPVRLGYLWRPVLRDPDDDMVLEAAVNAGASAIVTFNKRDFMPEADRFSLAIWSPGDLLRQLERRS